MTRIRKATRRLPASMTAFVLVGCAILPATQQPFDVELFDGYRMGQFLDEPTDLDVSAIPDAIQAPWYYDRELVSYTPEGEQAGPGFVLGSCAEYLALQGQEIWPAYYPDGPAFMTLAMMCKASQAIGSAEPAERSYIRSLAFDRTLPDRLPWQIAMIISGRERERIAERRPEASWREVTTALPVTKFESCGKYCGVYDDAGGSQEVRLVARADFDGDGIEDLLVSSDNAAKGGSYRATRMFVLTRRQSQGEIELIHEFDY